MLNSKFLLRFMFLLIIGEGYSQGIGIGITDFEVDKSAILEINSSDKGVLVTRMTSSQKNLIQSPAKGLLIFQIDGKQGFYYYTGTEWVIITGGDFINTTNVTLEQIGSNLVLTDSAGNTVSVTVTNLGTDTTNSSLVKVGSNLVLTDSAGDIVSVPISDLDTNITNASLVKVGADLVLTDSAGNTVSAPISDLDTNITNASLVKIGADLVLTDSAGNTVSVPITDLDTNTTNASLVKIGSNLVLTDSAGDIVSVPISDLDTNITNTSLVKVGTDLILTDSAGNTVSVPLADIDTNTTNASLSQVGANLILTDSEGNSVSVPITDLDTNTTNTSLVKVGADLVLTDSEGNSVSVPVTDLDTDTTNASLVKVGANLVLTDSAGNTVSVPLTDLDTDTTNVSLVKVGTDLILTDSAGNTVSVAITDLDTDDQTLSLVTNTLSISEGNSVDLAAYLDNTDNQDLSLIGNTLSVSRDPNTDVDLSGYLDNTDDQTLSLVTNTLSISEGNSVDLSSYLDDTDTDDQTLSLVTNTLSISEGNSVDLSAYLDNTDAQDLSLSGGFLSITGDATPVDVSALGTDDQVVDVFSLSPLGTLSLSLENDGEANKEVLGLVLAGGNTNTAALEIGTNDAQDLVFEANNTEWMRVASTGLIGIGTSTPSRALLDIVGSGGLSTSAGKLYDGSNHPSTLPTNRASSIHTDGYITSELGFLKLSDRRIKKDIEKRDGETDLDLINKLKVFNYKHIDVMQDGALNKIGFIAQEVKEIMPDGVNTQKGFIPNVYELTKDIKIKDTRVEITTVKEHGFIVGDLVKLVCFNTKTELSVVAVLDKNTFVVLDTRADITLDGVLVYGKQVDDFLSLEYNHLFVLNISATQELSKQVGILKKENGDLKEINTTMRKEIDEIKSMLKSMK